MTFENNLERINNFLNTQKKFTIASFACGHHMDNPLGIPPKRLLHPCEPCLCGYTNNDGWFVLKYICGHEIYQKIEGKESTRSARAEAPKLISCWTCRKQKKEDDFIEQGVVALIKADNFDWTPLKGASIRQEVLGEIFRMRILAIVEDFPDDDKILRYGTLIKEMDNANYLISFAPDMESHLKSYPHSNWARMDELFLNDL